MGRLAYRLAPLMMAGALAGCSSTGSGLDVTGLDPAAADPAVSALAPAETPQVAAAPGAPSVRFAPVVGATVEASEPLSRQLAARARERGIGVSRDSADYELKGYFSAISENGSTTVIYVWDVLDGAGNRVHRIQGQQRAPGGAADGWSSVDAATMQAIADRTIDELSAWSASRQG